MTTNAWTKGPLAVRRINDSPRPFAIVNETAKGDELVAGYISNEADAILYAAAPEMAEALEAIAKDPAVPPWVRLLAKTAIAKAQVKP